MKVSLKKRNFHFMFNRYLNGLQIRVFIIVTFTAIFWLLLFCYNRLLICFHDNYRRHDDYGCFRHHVCHFIVSFFLHWQWAFWCDLHWHCISWIFCCRFSKSATKSCAEYSSNNLSAVCRYLSRPFSASFVSICSTAAPN